MIGVDPHKGSHTPHPQHAAGGQQNVSFGSSTAELSAAELTGGHPVIALGMPGSRALIAGTGSHVAGSRLPGVPAVDRPFSELLRTARLAVGMTQEEGIWPRSR